MEDLIIIERELKVRDAEGLEKFLDNKYELMSTVFGYNKKHNCLLMRKSIIEKPSDFLLGLADMSRVGKVEGHIVAFDKRGDHYLITVRPGKDEATVKIYHGVVEFSETPCEVMTIGN